MTQRIVPSIILIGLTALSAACTSNGPAQLIPTATVENPMTIEASPTAAPQETVSTPTHTLPPPATAMSLPTDTPAATVTATVTATIRSTVVATRRPTSGGPLAFNYETVGIQGQPDGSAILTLRIVATGGSGRYTYYHDDVKQAGPTFTVRGTCGKPFVHTLKVTSTDGQSAVQQYFIGGVCGTPTPTPKP